EISIGAAETNGIRLGKAEEEIGEIETSAADRLAVGIERAGGQSGEGECTAPVGIGDRIVEVAGIAGAEAPVVLALAQRKIIIESETVDGSLGRASIGERAEVREAQIRRAEVDGV